MNNPPHDYALDKVRGEAENAPEGTPPSGRGLIKFLCRSLAILWKNWPRDMKATLIDGKTNRFSLSGRCPHCGLNSVFITVIEPHTTHVGTQIYEFAATMQCQGCLKYILGIVMKQFNKLIYQEHYPLGTPDDSVDKSVPANIAADFSEALRCLWVKSYKATVAMCRRSVEASCADLKATGKNLYAKIDNLADKGIITEPLKKMAHRVRLTANKELHGRGDDLNTFGEQEAEAIVACVREYFHHVYVMPALLKEYEKPKAAAGGTNPTSPPSGETT